MEEDQDEGPRSCKRISQKIWWHCMQPDSRKPVSAMDRIRYGSGKFEEMFPFEETEDQLQAIEAAKQDMESPKIMDRLICGDVGYGKTEIAIRVAFKAIQEGKQVFIWFRPRSLHSSITIHLYSG